MTTEKNEAARVARVILNGCLKASGKYVTVRFADLVLVLGKDQAAELVREHRTRKQTARTVAKLPRVVLRDVMEAAVSEIADDGQPEEREDEMLTELPTAAPGFDELGQPEEPLPEMVTGEE